jgi:superoxide reductase
MEVSMNRRNFIKFSSALSITSITGLYLPNAVFAENDILNSSLAGKIFYTENNPGRWAKKVNGHLPTFFKENNTLEVTTGHEMNGYKHYIIKHMLFDENFNLVNETMFDPENDAPVTTHNISKLKNKIYALSLCNKHDAWLNVLKV